MDLWNFYGIPIDSLQLQHSTSFFKFFEKLGNLSCKEEAILNLLQVNVR